MSLTKAEENFAFTKPFLRFPNQNYGKQYIYKAFCASPYPKPRRTIYLQTRSRAALNKTAENIGFTKPSRHCADQNDGKPYIVSLIKTKQTLDKLNVVEMSLIEKTKNKRTPPSSKPRKTIYLINLLQVSLPKITENFIFPKPDVRSRNHNNGEPYIYKAFCTFPWSKQRNTLDLLSLAHNSFAKTAENIIFAVMYFYFRCRFVALLFSVCLTAGPGQLWLTTFSEGCLCLINDEGVAKCGMHCEFQNSVNRHGPQRRFCFWHTPKAFKTTEGIIFT